METAHATVTQLLTEHRAQLDSLAQKLLAQETLDAADAYAAAGVVRQPTAIEPAITPA